MARTLRFAAAAVAVAGFTACNSDLEVMAPYKNITIVYAFLNAFQVDGTTPQTLQFVKINKAFLGEGNAYTYARIPDSTEFTDAQLQAEVQKLNDHGDVVASYALRDTILDGRASGIFNEPQHKLYCFNAVLDPTAQYRLHAIARGETITATTPLVGNISPHPTILAETFRFQFYNIGTYGTPQVRWGSGLNGKRYELSYRFRYDEVHQAGDTTHHDFVEYVGVKTASGTAENQQFQLSLNGESFYQTVAANVHPSADVVKRIFRGLDLIWAVGAPDLDTYLQLSSPISGIVEERPQYSNVQNGYGLFTSRSFREVKDRQLSDPSKLELVQGQYTGALGFCFPGSSPPLGCD